MEISIKNKLDFSLFFHDRYPINFVSNKFAEGYVNSDINVDMFLGIDILSIIINNKSIGVRYKDYYYLDEGKSALARTFYYGGNCCPPHSRKSSRPGLCAGEPWA